MRIDVVSLFAATDVLCQAGDRNPENRCSRNVEPTLIESSVHLESAATLESCGNSRSIGIPV